MSILDRYLIRAIFVNTLIVLAALMSILAFFSFVGRADDIGDGGFSVWTALTYTFFSLPRKLYEIFPSAALLGTLIGLGGLAASQELIAMRSSGLSSWRMGRAVVMVGLFFCTAQLVTSEIAVPPAEQRAQSIKALALDRQLPQRTASGFWSREGGRYINVREVLPDNTLVDIYVYELDASQALRFSTHAQTAHYKNNGWVFHDVTESRVADDSVETRHIEQMPWPDFVDPELLEVVTLKPEQLSLPGLYRYIDYLVQNDQDPTHYRLAFWSKLAAPVNLLVMMILAIPFVLVSGRMTGTGQRIMLGAMVGIGITLLGRILGHAGLVYGLNPVVGAFTPTLILVVFVWWRFSRIH